MTKRKIDEKERLYIDIDRQTERERERERVCVCVFVSQDDHCREGGIRTMLSSALHRLVWLEKTVRETAVI